MNRKQRRRKELCPLILQSKSLPSNPPEKILEDGTIEFTLKGFVSTTDKDFDGDIIHTDGIDLSRYLEHPIVKLGHKRGEEYNIGRTQKLEVRSIPERGKVGLWVDDMKIYLNPEISHHKTAINGLRRGLFGFSIGFVTKKGGIEEQEDGVHITAIELHEISLVDIPNNPFTVTKSINNLLQLHTNTMNVKKLMQYIQEKDVDLKNIGEDELDKVAEEVAKEVPELVEEKELETPEVGGEDPAEQEVAEVEAEEIVEEEATDDVVEESTEETEASEEEKSIADGEEVSQETEESGEAGDGEVVEEAEVAEEVAEVTEDEKSVEEGINYKSLSAKVEGLEKSLSEMTAQATETIEGLVDANGKLSSENEELKGIVQEALTNYKEMGILYKEDDQEQFGEKIGSALKRVVTVAE